MKIMGLSPIQVFGAIILGSVISFALIAGTSIHTGIEKETSVITPVPTPESVYITETPTPVPTRGTVITQEEMQQTLEKAIGEMRPMMCVLMLGGAVFMALFVGRKMGLAYIGATLIILFALGWFPDYLFAILILPITILFVVSFIEDRCLSWD